MKIILRLIVLPFVAAIHLVYILKVWVEVLINFVRYGGESLVYKEGDKATIAEMFELLKDSVK